MATIALVCVVPDEHTTAGSSSRESEQQHSKFSSRACCDTRQRVALAVLETSSCLCCIRPGISVDDSREPHTACGRTPRTRLLTTDRTTDSCLRQTGWRKPHPGAIYHGHARRQTRTATPYHFESWSSAMVCLLTVDGYAGVPRGMASGSIWECKSAGSSGSLTAPCVSVPGSLQFIRRWRFLRCRTAVIGCCVVVAVVGSSRSFCRRRHSGVEFCH